ncbi:co-chaperone SGT1 [Aspergillus neoniger CBS 115656]|uniref:CS-domain-containing protein n=1 Tax=Aspergillus neoniger (strain CBS 115656) TaxID=1448310 RepID=A0A318Y836_ASPNB|nr:CS-domain-containing protein [Aspergillus neoniger CBS 115656]PYH28830.1 CS-domain-containing protein [Aspergillus neoniger CBS 115656]
MNAASLGDTALQSSDPTTATLHYTTALLTHPRSPSYFIKRSTAFSRLKPTPNLPAALRDAESAVLLARERGKRELIVEAQMRRAIVLFLMGRYVAAEGVVGVVERMVGLDKDGNNGEDKEEKVRRAMGGAAAGAAGKGVEAEVRIWGAKIRAKVRGLEGNGEGDKVEEVPVGVKVPGEKELRAQLEELRGGSRSKSTVGGVTEKEGGQKVEDKAGKGEVEEKAEVKETQQQQQVKVRHEWYQSGETVVVTLYVKGVPKDKVAIELKEDSTSLQFPLPSGAEYDFTLDPLFAPIDPSTSKVSVFSTKIEISLRKKSPGQKWSALESSTGLTPQPVTTTPITTTTAHIKPQAQGPAYPTSSRHGAKDWDKLASSLTQKSKKDKPKNKDATKAEGKGEGEDDDEASDAESINSDFGGGDAVDGFFKKLYANADPDTRRAMVKSYVESQGTSLSTNWDEVGQGPVKVRPPSE